ncbi:MAG TPA: zf-HC2 domain-containing protein [Bacillota bacterium]|nr:zf-HC2 domain-containing protein [Bacillota bacterium]HOA15122.1 zf-HC2 domain-containing protein [Bacillota bacterium]HOG52742.1 zf-HC2 domain-containing protein [Bacillota bacterium]
MTCNKYERLLSAYLDRELTAEETMMVKRHIMTCAHCAEALEGYERVKAVLESLDSVEAPDGLFDMGVIRAKALALDMGRDEAAGSRRFGLFAFLGRAFIPAALVGTLVAMPILQLAFKVNITGAIAGLVRKEASGALTAEVVVPELNTLGYGSLEVKEASASADTSYGWISLGNTVTSQDLTLRIEDPRLSRYVQSFGVTGSGASRASYSRNW